MRRQRSHERGELMQTNKEQPKIEHDKGAAAYITEKSGVNVDWRWVQRCRVRENDPIPFARFSGRLVFNPSELDEWIARQWAK